MFTDVWAETIPVPTSRHLRRHPKSRMLTTTLPQRDNTNYFRNATSLWDPMDLMDLMNCDLDATLLRRRTLSSWSRHHLPAGEGVGRGECPPVRHSQSRLDGKRRYSYSGLHGINGKPCLRSHTRHERWTVTGSRRKKMSWKSKFYFTLRISFFVIAQCTLLSCIVNLHIWNYNANLNALESRRELHSELEHWTLNYIAPYQNDI